MEARLLKPVMAFCFLLTAALAAAQQQSHPAAPKPNPSASAVAQPSEKPEEAFVVESLRTIMRFENDGTGTRETTSTVHVLSEAGVKQLGLLTVGYNSANEDLTFPYVRVRKPDGTVIPTPPENIQDTTAAVSLAAPMFSDYHQKHVTVRGLAPGDRLEYDAVVRVHDPLIPGEFWASYTFARTLTVLDEELEVNVPEGRYVKVKSADVQPRVQKEHGRVIYLWKTSHPAGAPAAPSPDETAPPPVELTTFKSWEQVGRWWGGLEETRAVVTPELRAKALELTKDSKTDIEKAQVIYNYVALNFRYVSISFGIGRYQPHSADDVFKNAYGDCKDKHTLLAALLKAVGIEADSALINSRLKLDPDVPSPGQFDHVIGYLPLSSGPVWLDTTTEVGPFGYLIFNLRDKMALVIPPGKPAMLLKTVADPPFRSATVVEFKGKLGEDGTLHATAHWSVHDDAEVLLRAVFRSVGEDKWKDMVQAFSYAAGFGGEVSEVRVSPLDATASPLEYSYVYTRKDFPDWANKRVAALLPSFGLPQVSDKPEDRSKPIKLGQPTVETLSSTIELPKGYTPQLLPTVDLKRDFANYHSEYHFKDGSLITERRLVTKMREVPSSERAEYKSFLKAVNDEWGLYTEVRTGNSPVVAAASANPKVMELYNEAREAFLKHNIDAAVDDLTQAVTLDATFEQGWQALAGFRFLRNETREGMEAIRKGLALNPSDTQPYKFMALELTRRGHQQEATEVWRSILKQHPEDGDAHANLGSLLMQEKQYPDAVAEFEAAVKVEATKPYWQLQLGQAYVQVKDVNKAMAAFTQAIAIKKDALILNDSAWALADNNFRLADAERWAVEAVDMTEARSASISLDALSTPDLACMLNLGAYWDTLGWVYYRQGNLEKAERYLKAAWDLTEQQDIGEHLASVYEKEGKKVAARHQRVLAELLKNSEGVEAPPVLRHRDGSIAPPSRTGGTPFEELSQMRHVKLGKLSAKPGSAEFWVLFGPGVKVEQTKFISGEEQMRSLAGALQAARFNVSFPDDNPARLLRRGVLVCEGMNLGCDFTLFTPDSVKAVN